MTAPRLPAFFQMGDCPAFPAGLIYRYYLYSQVVGVCHKSFAHKQVQSNVIFAGNVNWRLRYCQYTISMARPRIDPSARKAVPLMVMVTADQKARLKRAAETAGLDLSAWIRALALQAAGTESGDHQPKKRRSGG